MNTQRKKLNCVKLTIYDWSSKSLKLQSKFYSARVIFPCLCAVYVYIIMTLLNNSSEATWSVSTKFQGDPTVETGLKVCSNGHAPWTIMPIYDKKKNNNKTFLFFKTKNSSNDDPFINDRIEECCITSACLQWLFHSSRGPWASCVWLPWQH